MKCVMKGISLLAKLNSFIFVNGQWPLDREIPAIGMTQEHQTHYRQEIFVAGVIGTGPQQISRPSESFFCCSLFMLSQGLVHHDACLTINFYLYRFDI